MKITSNTNIRYELKNPAGCAICLSIFAVVFMIYGLDVKKTEYKNLIHKTPNMDTLVGIGISSSFIYSMILILNGNHMMVHSLYFEASAVVIYFVKLVRFLD